MGGGFSRLTSRGPHDGVTRPRCGCLTELWVQDGEHADVGLCGWWDARSWSDLRAHARTRT
jgi:hypothetical protein